MLVRIRRETLNNPSLAISSNVSYLINVLIINVFIIRSKFFFLFIGRELTTWPANNCLQIMVCSCAMAPNFVWLQTMFCTCVKETVLFSFLWSLLREMADRLASRGYSLKKQTRWSNDKTVIELGYYKISSFVCGEQTIICRRRRVRRIIDLPATDKSRYFPQPRPIIVNYWIYK